MVTEYVKTICPYCGCGCGIYLHVKNGKVVRTSPAGKDSINKGTLCIKGLLAHEFVHSPERLKTPLVKENGVFREATWDEALGIIADRFRKIKEERGSTAFGVLSSARATCEENYLISKFARAVLATNNVDHCARL